MLRNATLMKELTIRFSGPVRIIKDPKAITPSISGISYLKPHEYEIENRFLIKKLGLHRQVYGKAMHRIAIKNNLQAGTGVRIWFSQSKTRHGIDMINDNGTLLFMYNNELFKSIRAIIYFITGQYPASLGDTFHACVDGKGRDLSYYLTMISLYHYKNKKVA
jgi:hypothetical protein